MRPDAFSRPRLQRGLALLAVVLLGLLAIVGSGGGFPPCEPPLCTGPIPPPPSATVTPAYLTAQVGSPANWTVSVAHLSGSLSYQWLRRDAGAAAYVEIPGATASSYGLPSVNLADDGASFLVTVSSGNGQFANALARLVVSATPGLALGDGEFLAQDWSVSPVQPTAPATPPTVLTERIETGGNPGAWRRMSVTLGSGTGSAAVFYRSETARYDPAAQGAVKVVDHAEDCALIPPNELVSVESALLIEQAGRRYVANTTSQCGAAAWAGRAGRASLAAQDFRLFDGPECGSGESCPDFSSAGAPLQFGYWRIAFATPGVTVVHAIDNWRVTVWR